MATSEEFQKRFIELTDDMQEQGKTNKSVLIGISSATFYNAYNYGIVPRTPSLMRIADHFKISVEYLIGLTDSEYFVKSANPSTFTERLNDLRLENRIPTIYELSQKLHIHRNNIRQWFKLNCLPLIDDVIIIADYFEVSVDYLLGRIDDRTPYR